MSHSADPQEIDQLLEEASEALGAGEPQRAAALARRGARLSESAEAPDRQADFLWLEGTALVDLGAAGAALALLDQALDLCPDHLDAMLERGHALYELCRFDEAEAQAHEVADAEPDEAWAHQQLGLLAERRGDLREAERRFARARRLDPEGFPAPLEVSRAEFEQLVEASLAAVPEPVRRHLVNVPVLVEDLPSEVDLAGADPPLSPGSLGLFRGAPYGQKVSADPWSHFPSAIVLFQRNLQRATSTADELAEEVRITLVHEIGHFLGLDEQELHDRGLE